MLNFDKPGIAGPPTEPGFLPRVLDGAGHQLDVERLQATMAVLEDYVDSMLEADAGPPMDSWLDDIDLELRVISL